MAKGFGKTRPKPSSSSRPRKDLLADTWFFEIGALVLGICAFIVIVVLLAHYDGKQQFQWNGVTLNAVASVLATIARIGMVVPVAEALAQWKWMHFSKDYKPLSDFGLLDDASRGTRGSILLLWDKKILTLTSIGAWIVILSIAVEPFFQQIISFQDAVSYADNSRVGINYATRWDGGTFDDSPPSDAYDSQNSTGSYVTIGEYGSVSGLTLDFQTQASVLFGMTTTIKGVDQQLKATCPSGNCTWPPYLTIGTCSKCNDVTSYVTRDQIVDFPMAWYFPRSGNVLAGQAPANLTSYSLPNGLSLNNRSPNQPYIDQANQVLLTTFTTPAPSQSISFRNATTLLSSTSILRIPASALDGYSQWIEGSPPDITAMECALYLCVKSYTSTMLNGKLSETFTEVSSTRDSNSWQVYYDSESVPAPGTQYIYLNGVSDHVDALYTNTTYLPRTDLSISIPKSGSTTNLDANSRSVTNVSATQPAIYALSAYIVDLFTSSVLDNAAFPRSAVDQFNCTIANGTKSSSCGHLRDVSGMVIIQNPLAASNTTEFDPPAMSVLFGSSVNASANDVAPAVFAALAESVTTAMRGDFSSGVGFSGTINGQLGTSHTLLSVRWAWISLPLLCAVVSAIFLLVSIVQASRDGTPLWRSSGLAYLAHGLDDRARGVVQGAELTSEIEEVVKAGAGGGVRVKLWRGVGGEGDSDGKGVLMLRSKEELPEKPVTAPQHVDGHQSEDEVETPSNGGLHVAVNQQGYQNVQHQDHHEDEHDEEEDEDETVPLSAGGHGPGHQGV